MPDARTISFLHSGDMGDIVAGMGAVKEYCESRRAKARLLLDTSGGWHDELCVRQSKGLWMKFGRAQLAYLSPLLLAQPFVACVEEWDGKEAPDTDLNAFRRGFCRPWSAETRKNLLYCHQKALGLPIGWRGPWLRVPVPSEPVREWLAARSSRYHASDQIFKKHLHEIGAFVGTDLELRAFEDCFRVKPNRVLAPTALDLAEEIAASRNIIVNGTLAYWIAVGVGHPHIVHEAGVNIPTTVFAEDVPGLEYAQGAGIKPKGELR